ncbi:hypothetical protein F5X71_00305 [Nocardia brasiliensis]|uniref:Uncharacterized protein n=1 Tax=Nocardia brasiliensis TaxID=37326 RepID=A0A6G9XJ83_NOCBR|nr:DUF3422 domain-containing protein [Nocardia brasiliensis]QIS00975.1 hypothetical protein F5X71_00305 [Nocardia brasiliensis]
MAWFETYERDVLGAPGVPWPTKPRTAPSPEPPAPLEATAAPEMRGEGLPGLLLAAVRSVVGVVCR